MQEYPEFPTRALGPRGDPFFRVLGRVGDRRRPTKEQMEENPIQRMDDKYDKFNPFPTSNTHLTILFEPFRTHFGG